MKITTITRSSCKTQFMLTKNLSNSYYQGIKLTTFLKAVSSSFSQLNWVMTPGHLLYITLLFAIISSLFMQSYGWRVIEQSWLTPGFSTSSTDISLTTLEVSHCMLEVLLHLPRLVSHPTWSKWLAVGLPLRSKSISISTQFSSLLFFVDQTRHLFNDLISRRTQFHFRRCHWYQGISVFG